MARHDLRDELHQQVTMSIEKGAKLLCAEKFPDNAGAFYPATVLTNVKEGNAGVRRRVVWTGCSDHRRQRTKLAAIRIANDSVFGLGAAVFTSDAKRGERIATEEIEAGSCFVNASVNPIRACPLAASKSQATA